MTLARWFQAYGETAQYVAYFGLLALFLALERVVPGRDSGAHRRGRWSTNFGLTALNVVVLGALPFSFVSTATWARERGWGFLNLGVLPETAVIVATLALRAFISWVTHLLMHQVPLFWRVHRVHHTDPELDASTTVRFHPLEFPIALGVGAPLVVVFGLEPVTLLAYELLDVAVTLFSHANLRIPAPLERVLRLFVVTPDLHRVHHSTRPAQTDSNYGAVFPLWDLVFGTFRTAPREELATQPLGLAEVRDARARRLGWLLALPFRRLRAPEGAASPAGAAPVA